MRGAKTSSKHFKLVANFKAARCLDLHSDESANKNVHAVLLDEFSNIFIMKYFMLLELYG